MPKPTPSIVALIPARSGSKRIANKNIRPLSGHPLMAYTIAAALDSGIFQRVIVSTDSARYAEIAEHYGAEVPFLRPIEYATSYSPDIEWVTHALGALDPIPDCFAILRPTAPFRQPETIRRAWEQFRAAEGAHSLRAVTKCTEHPGKMWAMNGAYHWLSPILPYRTHGPSGVPWHSSQYPSLPHVYVQDASLEIAWSRIALESRSIAGDLITGFVSQGYEGFDVNLEEDWLTAEALLERGLATLPKVSREAYGSVRSD